MWSAKARQRPDGPNHREKRRFFATARIAHITPIRASSAVLSADELLDGYSSCTLNAILQVGRFGIKRAVGLIDPVLVDNAGGLFRLPLDAELPDYSTPARRAAFVLSRFRLKVHCLPRSRRSRRSLKIRQGQRLRLDTMAVNPRAQLSARLRTVRHEGSDSEPFSSPKTPSARESPAAVSPPIVVLAALKRSRAKTLQFLRLTQHGVVLTIYSMDQGR
jgi:hypothetical protein